jgi:hypothetical protein
MWAGYFVKFDENLALLSTSATPPREAWNGQPEGAGLVQNGTEDVAVGAGTQFGLSGLMNGLMAGYQAPVCNLTRTLAYAQQILAPEVRILEIGSYR